MAKKITGYIKLQVSAGKANPSPPVGPALGQHGVNIMEFCKAFNARSQEQGYDQGVPLPVVITVMPTGCWLKAAQVWQLWGYLTRRVCR